MSYRPITDVWWLARAKLLNGQKYYGAYPGGFPERARVLIGASLDAPMLHVCGGKARHYPYARGFGKFDETLDLDMECKPDWLLDCRFTLPTESKLGKPWSGMLIDPPYSPADAREYFPGEDKYPNPNKLMKDCLKAVPRGSRVGMLHYVIPRCPKDLAKFVAFASVNVGFGNRTRAFSVYERL